MVGACPWSKLGILFFGSKDRLGLRHTQASTLYKNLQMVRLDILRTSVDETCRAVYKVILSRQSKYAQRFAAAPTLEQASAAIVTQKLKRPGPARAGLGYTSGTLIQETDRRVECKHIADGDRSKLVSKLDSLAVQGRMKAWVDTMQLDLSWKRIVTDASPKSLLFAVQAAANVVPTQDNLRRWGVRHVDLRCKLCDRVAPTLRHELTCCPVALSQGRYTWRHNSVLAQVVACLQDGIMRGKHQHDSFVTIPPIDSTFIRAGERRTKRNVDHTEATVLSSASDWCLLHDLNGDLVIPQDICASTGRRPDLFLHQAIIGELTVPDEDRLQVSNDIKTDRYAPLRADLLDAGWTCPPLQAFAVGSRGFVPPTLRHFLTSVGITTAAARRCVADCSEVAYCCSYLIHLCANWPVWSERPLLRPKARVRFKNPGKGP